MRSTLFRHLKPLQSESKMKHGLFAFHSRSGSSATTSSGLSALYDAAFRVPETPPLISPFNLNDQLSSPSQFSFPPASPIPYVYYLNDADGRLPQNLGAFTPVESRDFSPSLPSPPSTTTTFEDHRLRLFQRSSTALGGETFSSGPSVGPRHESRSAIDRTDGESDDEEFAFTVLSFNVLAQSHVETHRSDLYSQIPSRDLEWESRRRLILARILAHDADVICLQEVEQSHFHDFFFPVLTEHGYDGRFKKRTNGPSDGLAIFYRRRRLQLVKFHPVEMNKGVRVLDRDNVGVVALFEPIVPAAAAPDGNGLTYCSLDPICVATAHLLFNPRRGDIKLAQLAVLFSELDLVARKVDPRYRNDLDPPQTLGYVPIVFCGDMNFEPHFPLFDFVVKGMLRYAGLDQRRVAGTEGAPSSPPKQGHLFRDHFLPPFLGISSSCKKMDATNEQNAARVAAGVLSHDFKFRSVYHAWDGEDSSPGNIMTTNHDRASSCVDFIFFNPGPDFRVIRRSSVPRAGTAPKMPNSQEGSDHYPIAATFSIKGRTKVQSFS